MNTFKVGDKVICTEGYSCKYEPDKSILLGKEYTIGYVHYNGNVLLNENLAVYEPCHFKLKENNQIMTNKKIAIKVGNNQELSRIVQEFLFTKGYYWPTNGVLKIHGNSDCIALDSDVFLTEPKRLWESREEYWIEHGYTIYDAALQFGEIVTLLSEPPKPVIKIKNDAGQEYEAKFHKEYVEFGCAKISNRLFQVFEKALLKTTIDLPDCKIVEQIKIGRGLFTPADIKAIVEHPDFGKGNE